MRSIFMLELYCFYTEMRCFRVRRRSLRSLKAAAFLPSFFSDGRSAGLPHDMVHDNRFDGKTIKAKYGGV